MKKSKSFVIYLSEDNVPCCHVGPDDEYKTFRENIPNDRVLCDNGEFTDHQWPIDDEKRVAFLHTLQKHLKGRGIKLNIQ